ncbi:MAG: hypothetical protein AAF211_17405, partial [Myxococcota bacterium]
DVLLRHERGPLWDRGYLLDPEPAACRRLSQALDQLEAERMVVGHTTQRDGVMRSRCDGRLFAIDVGIAGPYGQHAGALEIIGDAVTALYVDPDGSLRRHTFETAPQPVPIAAPAHEGALPAEP